MHQSACFLVKNEVTKRFWKKRIKTKKKVIIGIKRENKT
jgi:hypothetical protein